MSEFPTLAEVVDRVTDTQSPLRYRGASGLARLGCNVAKSWRDACTITTVEQLDALPDGAVVLCSGVLDEFGGPGWGNGSWHKGNDGESSWFHWSMDYGDPSTEVPLPAQLLWHPDWSKA